MVFSSCTSAPSAFISAATYSTACCACGEPLMRGPMLSVKWRSWSRAYGSFRAASRSRAMGASCSAVQAPGEGLTRRAGRSWYEGRCEADDDGADGACAIVGAAKTRAANDVRKIVLGIGMRDGNTPSTTDDSTPDVRRLKNPLDTHARPDASIWAWNIDNLAV